MSKTQLLLFEQWNFQIFISLGWSIDCWCIDMTGDLDVYRETGSSVLTCQVTYIFESLRLLERAYCFAKIGLAYRLSSWYRYWLIYWWLNKLSIMKLNFVDINLSSWRTPCRVTRGQMEPLRCNFQLKLNHSFLIYDIYIYMIMYRCLFPWNMLFVWSNFKKLENFLLVYVQLPNCDDNRAPNVKYDDDYSWDVVVAID